MQTVNHFSEYKIIIVGSGFFGSTIARLFADRFNERVLILEKRNHIGGNAWTEVDADTGIEIHKYGSHLFHTSNLEVWRFVNRFSDFNNYRHSVVSNYANKFYPIPINLMTLSQFYGRTFTPTEAKILFDSFRSASQGIIIDNFEDAAIKSIGKELYEAFFAGYTEKQWQTSPRLLPKETFGRIPVRLNFDNSYFSDTFEGLPVIGYGKFFANLIDSDCIDIVLGLDFFEVKDQIPADTMVVYTGPLDKFFNYQFGNLGWRTLDFTVERIDQDDFQGTSVVNYPGLEYPFTRIHEFKHLHPERHYSHGKTIIMKEFSRLARTSDEPYYPINSPQDRKRLLGYRKLMREIPNVIFGGRLGTYKYLDMHMAIASAFRTFSSEIEPRYLC